LAFEAFSLRQHRAAVACPRLRKHLEERASALLRALQLPEAEGLQLWRRAVGDCLARPESEWNRAAWRAVAADAPPTLRKLVALYLCNQDSTGCVERGLGRVIAIFDKHKGHMDGLTMQDLTVLALDGPAEESAFTE
jgi:hypothetical protein